MYQYPYGNAQQLNLDWILSKLQELESGSGGGADLEEVANALVSASFDATIPYRRYDYAFYDGKLYRALNDNIGAFNPADWMEVVIGDDIPVLTRLINAKAGFTDTASIPSGGDLDNYGTKHTGGAYYIATDVTNSPDNYGMLYAVGQSDDVASAASQIFVNKNHLYYRGKSGNPATFGNWYEAANKTDISTLTTNLSNLQTQVNQHLARAVINPVNLTDAWLLTAADGEYKIEGNSVTGSFIDGAASGYGVLKVVKTPDYEAGISPYGYIIYITTTGQVYHRSFRRDAASIVWRYALTRLTNATEFTPTTTDITSIVTWNTNAVDPDNCTARIQRTGNAAIVTFDAQFLAHLSASTPNAPNIPICFFPAQYAPLFTTRGFCLTTPSNAEDDMTNVFIRTAGAGFSATYPNGYIYVNKPYFSVVRNMYGTAEYIIKS